MTIEQNIVNVYYILFSFIYDSHNFVTYKYCLTNCNVLVKICKGILQKFTHFIHGNLQKLNTKSIIICHSMFLNANISNTKLLFKLRNQSMKVLLNVFCLLRYFFFNFQENIPFPNTYKNYKTFIQIRIITAVTRLIVLV